MRLRLFPVFRSGILRFNVLVLAVLSLTSGVSYHPAHAQGVVLVGAGDISTCGSEGDELTAKLLDKIDGIVFTAGDNVYPTGDTKYWQECYEPTWGRHKARTRPAAGNHDLFKGSLDNYYAYFGENAGPKDLGYYSFDAGGWHIVVLNSMLPISARSPQEQWFRADLAAHPSNCTLAIWHHVVFSSSVYAASSRFRNAFRIAYEAGVDVVISGDTHHYERFAPMDYRGRADPEHGVRQFVVGTGGASLNPLGARLRTTEKRISGEWGVLKLALVPGSYSWEFVPAVNPENTDSGSAPCVDPKPPAQ